MESIAVVIPAFGEMGDLDALLWRAVESVKNQTVYAEVVTPRLGPLSVARNTGAFTVDSDWLIFLDADDELDPHYIEEMLKGKGDIRQPSTLGVVDGVEDDFPVLIPPHPGGFLVGNHLIIGCMVRRELFNEVGSFNDLPILEDWDCYIRMVLAGAKVGTCPGAIYRVHVLEGSRNKGQEHGYVYGQIQQRYQSAWAARFRGDESSMYEMP